MVLLCDTREQDPIVFPPHPWVDRIERTTLQVGDYQARFRDGTIPPVSFERKSLGDLFGTMTGGYKRFKEEVRRARDLQTCLKIIVEAPLAAVWQGTRYSEFPGPSMVQKCFTLMVRHRIQVIFCADRREMARYMLEYFLSIGREYALQHRSTGRA